MARGSGHGFVLVATLWILAAIALGAAFFAERVAQSRRLAQQSLEISQALTEIESTRAEILFRLSTTRFSVHGVGESPTNAMWLDDSPYRGTGEDIVRLQDHRGLVNLNRPDAGLLFRLLGQFGVPIEYRDRMLDTLLDYTDADDLHRLNGAESREYAGLGLPAPPNDWLSSPYQARNIIGWRDREELWKDGRFLRVVMASRVSIFNPNTAPREVIASQPGSSLEIADIVMKERRNAPLATLNLLAALTGQSLANIEDYSLTPGNSVRITLYRKGMPWMFVYGITFTPTSELWPWRVDYHARTPLPYVHADDIEFPSLPERAAQPAAIAEAL